MTNKRNPNWCKHLNKIKNCRRCRYAEIETDFEGSTSGFCALDYGDDDLYQNNDDDIVEL